MNISIRRSRCLPFRGYLYICCISLGSPSAKRWKNPKTLKRKIAESVVVGTHTHTGAIFMSEDCISIYEVRRHRNIFERKYCRENLFLWREMPRYTIYFFTRKIRVRIIKKVRAWYVYVRCLYRLRIRRACSIIW